MWLFDYSRLLLIGMNVAIFLFAWRSVRRDQESQESQGDERGNSKKDAVLIVTAHPDDEIMFFGPTIVQLVKMGRAVDVLCLSRGQDDPNLREKELRKSCVLLGVRRTSVGRFKDGPRAEWDVDDVARSIEKELERGDFKSVLTFDSRGVSGHINHVACSVGARQCKSLALPKCANVNLLELVSVSLPYKYLGVVYAFGSMILGSSSSATFLQWDPLLVWRVMGSCYQSQWTWYRRLYALFASYVFINHYNLVSPLK